MFEILNAMYVVQYIYVLGDELNKLLLSFESYLKCLKLLYMYVSICEINMFKPNGLKSAQTL